MILLLKNPLERIKKYMAYLKSNPELPAIHFGALKEDGTPYEQFKDLTPLKLYFN